jgi:hypothetical protein
MAEPKTKRTEASVEEFLNSIKDDEIRKDCWTVVELMQQATKAKPQMWGPSIVGFGEYQYKYANGREMTWMITAFSPRKKNITLYIMSGFEGYDELLAQLGTYSCGKSCVYIKRLSDIRVPILKKLITTSVKQVMKTNAARAGK